MPKNKKQKQSQVEAYRAKLQQTKTIFVVETKGINPNETNSLKKQLNELDSSFHVIKNTLFKIALKEEGLPVLVALDNDQRAVLFADGPKASEAAKVLSKFIKDTDKLKVVSGLLDGAEITTADVESLATLPSKEQLLGQLLSVFNGPMRGLVTVLNGNMREFVYALNAIKEKKEAAA